MKIIEAMKKRKDLKRKADDLRKKIQKYHADHTHETLTYENQSEKISEWLQSHEDCLREYARLSIAIMRTNLATDVTIEIDGKQVTRSLAYWVLRKQGLCQEETMAWRVMDDKRLPEGTITQSNGEKRDVKIRRHYDPETRDKKLAVLQEEPSLVDARLEIINATTDLVGVVDDA